MTKTLATLLISLCSALFAYGQASAVDEQKVDAFAHAIASAEGFGAPHAIPTRYHNPGDIKSRLNFTKLPGQKSIGKGGHIVFKNDAAGWAALKDQIAKMLDGRSHHFNPDMTIQQVAKHYASNWRPWVKIVTKELGVQPNTTLAAFFAPEDEEPPTIVFAPSQFPDLLASEQY